MKKFFALIAGMFVATSAQAGNLAEFEAPAEVEEEAVMGGSNAAWIVPLIAIIAIAAASGGDDGKTVIDVSTVDD